MPYVMTIRDYSFFGLARILVQFRVGLPLLLRLGCWVASFLGSGQSQQSSRLAQFVEREPSGLGGGGGGGAAYLL